MTMAKSRKKKKKKAPVRVGTASWIGIAVGLGIAGVGIYGVMTTGKTDAYAIAGLGIVWVVLVAGLTIIRR